jgi:cyclic lactone autoinducer peptide
MKKLTRKINGALAKIAYRTAVKGAGLASHLGWHQPKVPNRLTK